MYIMAKIPLCPLLLENVLGYPAHQPLVLGASGFMKDGVASYHVHLEYKERDDNDDPTECFLGWSFKDPSAMISPLVIWRGESEPMAPPSVC